MNNIVFQPNTQKQNKWIIPGFIAMTLACFFITACNKIDDLKNTGGSGSAVKNYYIDMTDAPGNYDQVNVNVIAVYALTNQGEVELNVVPKMYNLLDLTNGVDTLIAVGGLGTTVVSQIRLVLGTGNTIMVDSVLYPLNTPSGMQSGLKLQVHHALQAGVAYHVLLDFDANLSVHQTGNDKYILKPVIRVVDTALSGSIKGLILPVGVNSTVTATASGGGLTYTGSVDLIGGGFLLKGVAAGVYDITITPAAPYLPVTITSVTVVNGVVTDIGVVTL